MVSKRLACRVSMEFSGTTRKRHRRRQTPTVRPFAVRSDVKLLEDSRTDDEKWESRCLPSEILELQRTLRRPRRFSLTARSRWRSSKTYKTDSRLLECHRSSAGRPFFWATL
ncbi:hypothetical protein L596_024627 [Steinernema carpocapsae]|uniref:Uncharacterized protein n=1 Tax=Steinernema carpocapsae TaxID=34508 RepID=A0A4U5M5B1_STECR|nr:hypothetical protein L596_024627 [Steinernema carpocapsae]